MSGPSKRDSSKMHWRDRYEVEAGQAFNSTMKLDEKALIARVEKNLIDPYFTTWRALARKGTVANAAMPMWRYLQRKPGKHNMLNRYHCAAALFEILGMPDPASESELRKQVQWDSHGEEARQEALLRLKKIIEELQAGGK